MNGEKFWYVFEQFVRDETFYYNQQSHKIIIDISSTDCYFNHDCFSSKTTKKVEKNSNYCVIVDLFLCLTKLDVSIHSFNNCQCELFINSKKFASLHIVQKLLFSIDTFSLRHALSNVMHVRLTSKLIYFSPSLVFVISHSYLFILFMNEL